MSHGVLHRYDRRRVGYVIQRVETSDADAGYLQRKL